VDETSFPNAKPRHARLIAYKAFADLAGKGSLLVITIVAARRLAPASFGVFALGSTLGWIVTVVSDCGIQLHLARAVARAPADASQLLRGWLRVRVWTAAGAVAVVATGLAIGWRPAASVPILVLTVVYACGGLIEFLHYFYRGLSRSDVESSITVWQRVATLGCGLSALVWKPDVTLLACAMLIPVVVTLAISLRIARGIARLKPCATSEAVARDVGVAQGFSPAIADARLKPCATSGSTTSGSATFDVFRRDVWPIGAGILLSALYFRIDVFLVQLWSGTESVAFYNAVFRLIEALRLFPAAVLAVVLPSLIRAGDLRPLARVAVPVTGFAIAAAAVLWIGAGWLIPFLYGAPYARAVPAFRVLLLALPLLSLNFALTHQLVGWDGQRVYARLCALALVTNLVLNARLIPLWSIEGAAWATLGTEIVLTVGCGIALWSARAPAPAGRLVMEP
jgi:O-antigen/teichoic acid export membrane protein